MIKTEIGYTTPSKITVREKDLARELIGKIDFVDGLVLCAMNRMPTPQEKNLLNALLVVGLDHGLTPSAIVTRLTYLGAPESLQGAVAAGLLGAGSRFLGTTESAIRMFSEFVGEVNVSAGVEGNLAVARKLIETRKERGESLYGYGHPIHKPFDPRVATLRDVAEANGFLGKHWMLAEAVARVLSERAKPINMNASSAMAATIADSSLEPTLAAGLVLVGRCGGLIAHIIEERASPVAGEIWDLVLKQDSRNEIPERATRT